MFLHIDIETFSSVELKKSGVHRYVEAPDFQVMLFGFAFGGQTTQVIDLTAGEQIPDHVLQALDSPMFVKKAFNAAFEIICLRKHFSSDRRFRIDHKQWQCTMAHATYCGYPGNLSGAAKALGLAEDKQKMKIGSNLIKYFCAPCKPTKVNLGRTRNLPHHEPEKWKLFKEYCAKDVEVEMEIERVLSKFPMPQSEIDLWHIDFEINNRGVMLDEELVDSANIIIETIKTDLFQEAQRITGLENPLAHQQFKPWLATQGVNTESTAKDAVEELLKRDLPGSARRALEIFQTCSKTSLAKYETMKDRMCLDGRARGILQYYGAKRTGRWSGRAIQPQNLPRNYVEPIEVAKYYATKRNMQAIELLFGDTLDILSQLLRTAIVPKENHFFAISDFTAIEGVVLAYFAKEEWALEVFRTHGNIYEATASQMFGIPLERIKKGNPEYSYRSKGKVATLALGYQGSKGALINMGALNSGIPEEDLPEIVNLWREKNRRIVDFWGQVESAALYAFRTGQSTGVNGIIFSRETDPENELDFLTAQLPSGRKLFYVKPHIAMNHFDKEALHYYGVDDKTGNWRIDSTYGGKLTENIVQAIARDILAHAIKNLERRKIDICIHIHDEVVAEVSNRHDRDFVVNELNKIMSLPIPWAPDIPLKAAGFATDFYMKD